MELTKILLVLYIEKKKNVNKILIKKNYKKPKTTKQSHAYKSYASINNIEILNSFNSELHFQDTQSAIRKKTGRFID